MRALFIFIRWIATYIHLWFLLFLIVRELSFEIPTGVDASGLNVELRWSKNSKQFFVVQPHPASDSSSAVDTTGVGSFINGVDSYTISSDEVKKNEPSSKHTTVSESSGSDAKQRAKIKLIEFENENGINGAKISQGCDSDESTCFSTIEYESLDRASYTSFFKSLVDINILGIPDNYETKLYYSSPQYQQDKNEFEEDHAYVIGTGMKLTPGYLHRFSVTIETLPSPKVDSRSKSRNIRVGLGSVDGVIPGSSRHREWVVNGDGSWTVVGVADSRFDINNDMLWGAHSLDGWKEFGQVGDNISVTVDLRSNVDPYVSFELHTSTHAQTETKSGSVRHRLVMSLDGFEKVVESRVWKTSKDFNEKLKLNTRGFEQSQQMVIQNTGYEFELARFGPELPVSRPLNAKLVMTNPPNACSSLINQGKNNVTGRIAFVMRGSCDFLDKVLNAQEFGALAVIVGNNRDSPANEPLEMVVMDAGNRALESLKVKIPALFVSYSTVKFVQKNLAPGRNSGQLSVSINGPMYTPPSLGWSLLDVGLYPVIWLPPNQRVRIEKTQSLQGETTTVKKRDYSHSWAKEFSLETCRPVTYLPLSFSDVSDMLDDRDHNVKMPHSIPNIRFRMSKRLVRTVLSCGEPQVEPTPSVMKPNDDRREQVPTEQVNFVKVIPMLNAPWRALPWSDVRMRLMNIQGRRPPDFDYKNEKLLAALKRFFNNKYSRNWRLLEPEARKAAGESSSGVSTVSMISNANGEMCKHITGITNSKELADFNNDNTTTVGTEILWRLFPNASANSEEDNERKNTEGSVFPFVCNYGLNVAPEKSAAGDEDEEKDDAFDIFGDAPDGVFRKRQYHYWEVSWVFPSHEDGTDIMSMSDSFIVEIGATLSFQQGYPFQRKWTVASDNTYESPLGAGKDAWYDDADTEEVLSHSSTIGVFLDLIHGNISFLNGVYLKNAFHGTFVRMKLKTMASDINADLDISPSDPIPKLAWGFDDDGFRFPNHMIGDKKLFVNHNAIIPYISYTCINENCGGGEAATFVDKSSSLSSNLGESINGNCGEGAICKELNPGVERCFCE